MKLNKTFFAAIIFTLCFSLKGICQYGSWVSHDVNEKTNGRYLTDVHFVTENYGWAVGADGTIIHTSDGGANWQEQNRPRNIDLNGVHFINKNEGWVCAGGTILYTEDGGDEWDIQGADVNAGGNDIFFATHQIGWCVDDKKLFYTDNGGDEWNKLDYFDHSRPVGGNDIDCIEPSKIRVASYKRVYKSNDPYPDENEDEDNNWIDYQIYGLGKVELRGIDMITEDKGWAVGEEGTVVKRKKQSLSGNYWVEVDNIAPNTNLGDRSLYEVVFPTKDKGWILGQGTILHTNNGGSSWFQHGDAPSSDVHLMGVSFVDEGTGWAVGNGVGSDVAVYEYTKETPTPAAVDLDQPEPKAQEVSTNPDLSWDEAPKAERYQIQIFEDDELDSIFIDWDDVDPDTLQIRVNKQLEFNETYYWRVRGINYRGKGEWSGRRSFTTKCPDEKPGQVELLSPKDDTNGIDTSTVLSWKQANRAISYKLQVAKNRGFSPTIIDKEKGRDSTQHHIAGALEPDQKYYWRVMATNCKGDGRWSDKWQFTTITPSNYPHLSEAINPEDGEENVDLRPKLAWTETKHAKSYRLQVSNKSRIFTNNVIDKRGITQNHYELKKDLNYNDTIYWRVEAINKDGQDRWSGPWQFTTETPAKPQKVGLLLPSDNAKISAVNQLLSWDDTTFAQTYELQVSEDSNFYQIVIEKEGLRNTEYRLQGELNQNETYYWRVRAKNPKGSGAWSDHREFTTVTTGSWIVHDLKNIDGYLNDVYFVNEEKGWAVGANGTIVHTDNGGDSWHKQKSYTNKELKGVHFVNEKKGWISGEDIVLHTDNGGKTRPGPGPGRKGWDEQNETFANTTLGGEDIYFVTEQKGWCVKNGNDGALFYTKDGGESWEQESFNGPYDLNGYDIEFLNETGWLTSDASIFETDAPYDPDKNNNWSYEQLIGLEDTKLRGIEMIDEKTGWAVGENGTVANIRDSEKNPDQWSVVESLAPNADLEGKKLYEVTFPNEDIGWILGEGTILYTKDGGKNWGQHQDAPASDVHIMGVSFVNENTGWAVGNGAGYREPLLYEYTSEAPEQVSLSKPEGGAEKVAMLPELSWEGVDFAKNYEVQVSQDLNFDNIFIHEHGVANTSYHIHKELTPQTTYYWRVRAISHEKGEWSSKREFKTKKNQTYIAKKKINSFLKYFYNIISPKYKVGDYSIKHNISAGSDIILKDIYYRNERGSKGKFIYELEFRNLEINHNKVNNNSTFNNDDDVYGDKLIIDYSRIDNFTLDLSVKNQEDKDLYLRRKETDDTYGVTSIQPDPTKDITKEDNYDISPLDIGGLILTFLPYVGNLDEYSTAFDMASVGLTFFGIYQSKDDPQTYKFNTWYHDHDPKKISFPFEYVKKNTDEIETTIELYMISDELKENLQFTCFVRANAGLKVEKIEQKPQRETYTKGKELDKYNYVAADIIKFENLIQVNTLDPEVNFSNSRFSDAKLKGNLQPAIAGTKIQFEIKNNADDKNFSIDDHRRLKKRLGPNHNGNVTKTIKYDYGILEEGEDYSYRILVDYNNDGTVKVGDWVEFNTYDGSVDESPDAGEETDKPSNDGGSDGIFGIPSFTFPALLAALGITALIRRFRA